MTSRVQVGAINGLAVTAFVVCLLLGALPTVALQLPFQ